MKKVILSLLALTVLIYSCSKDDDDDDKFSNDQLVGKWHWASQYRNVVTNNVGKRDTLYFPEGTQSWEFLKNGTLYLSVRTPGGIAKDTGKYKINGSDVIMSYLTSKDTFKLLSISSTALQAYKKLIHSSTKYSEFWFNYKKQ
jgi:hypothetical protein